MQKPLVIVTRKLPPVIEACMAEQFDARLRDADTPLSAEDLATAVQEADILVPTITDVIDADVLNAAGGRLRLIANFGAGVDHIDVKTASAKGITVTNTPGVLTEDTADIAMALILAVPRRITEGARYLQAHANEWQGWAPTFFLGQRLGGKKLGIIGMGRIGQAVAHRARSFGLEIHYHSRKRVAPEIERELAVTYWKSLDEMLPHMDVVSVNCPLTPSTYRLLSAGRLKLMKKTAWLVNTARGEIVDENALADMLEAGELAGAGLDVYEGEPRVNPRLLALKNAVLLPHLGSATEEARTEMGEKVIANIEAFVEGREPPDRVVPSVA